ncbi:MAG: Maf family nucleotide pyrophosphatase [Pseudomonadota bacterium]
MAPPVLILGSSSRYRAALLQRLGLDFIQRSPDIDETPHAEEDVATLVARLAREKALAIAKHEPRALIIASDQAAAIGNTILGKPGNAENALRQLQQLQGQTVTFYTSLCLYDAGARRAEEALDQTRVVFRALSDRALTGYIDREQPFDCAGAFKSEGLGVALFEAIHSEDPTALIGLPLIALCGLLARAGLPVLES